RARSDSRDLHSFPTRRSSDLGGEFDLWLTQNGPRVFGIHEFTGTHMAWLALEDRVLVADNLWGLMGVGVAPFLDYGGAWYSDERSGEHTSELQSRGHLV